MCGCECCISSKIKSSYLLTWCDSYLKIFKEQSKNEQNIRLGEMKSRIFETYKNDVMPHGCHIHKMTPGVVMAKMCLF